MEASEKTFIEARQLVVTEGKVFHSFLQRHLGVSWAESCALIERLEAEKVISAANAGEKRTVLLSKADLGKLDVNVPAATAEPTAHVPESAENVSAARLKSYLDRIERLESEKKGLADDIKEIYLESKGGGFDPKTIRTLVRLRKMDTNKRHEEEELLELYKASVGLD